MRIKVAWLFLAAVGLSLFCASAVASDVKFGVWQHDKQEGRYYCEYQYPAKTNPTQINVQILIWYPDDKDRRNFYYFANKKNQYWGRCVCPADPNYNPQVMQWAKLTDGKWKDLPKGDCPAPGDGDSQRASIDKIPKPPI
jgi:hypothetical protein